VQEVTRWKEKTTSFSSGFFEFGPRNRTVQKKIIGQLKGDTIKC
jgi:hypothetical protein